MNATYGDSQDRMPSKALFNQIRWIASGCASVLGDTVHAGPEPIRSAASAGTQIAAAVQSQSRPGMSLFVLVGLGLLVVLLGWRWRMRFLPDPGRTLHLPVSARQRTALPSTSHQASTRADVARARLSQSALEAPDTGPASYAALPGEAELLAGRLRTQPEPALGPVTPTSEGWDELLATDSLVDVEQQADFFLALGQDEAAKGLLAEALDAAPTPRLHLKLADILSRHGDREAWEALRLRTEARFNLAMPAWEAHTGPDRGLEAHPLALARLVAIWPNPLRAASTLGKSLRRPAAGRPDRQRFDLSAYRELMLLHAIACDVARQIAVTEVDIELPVGDESPSAPGSAG
ncbi:type IV pilus assembly protein FimV [Aquariibacter albus]|uniref:Tetratricopeptide repeat protein n=1 Tax=Aquariibacter albus TaxID=2759899 RepID=A0A839HTM8_9BURK|nr:hypothetical protein [Aquariibacter albus]MBB1161304.1 hypothetical protein [Aquariibacter albus]